MTLVDVVLDFIARITKATSDDRADPHDQDGKMKNDPMTPERAVAAKHMLMTGGYGTLRPQGR